MSLWRLPPSKSLLLTLLSFPQVLVALLGVAAAHPGRSGGSISFNQGSRGGKNINPISDGSRYTLPFSGRVPLGFPYIYPYVPVSPVVTSRKKVTSRTKRSAEADAEAEADPFFYVPFPFTAADNSFSQAAYNVPAAFPYTKAFPYTQVVPYTQAFPAAAPYTQAFQYSPFRYGFPLQYTVLVNPTPEKAKESP